MAQETLTIVFTRGRTRLMSLARRILGNEESAEDALQDAFCRLWPSAKSIQTETEAEKLANATLHNICIDKVREEERHTTEEIDERTMDSMSYDEAQTLEERQEQYEAIHQIIQSRLTPLQQRILQRHDAEGCSYEQLAIEERMTEMALRQQLSRARRTVRDCYRAMKNGTPLPPKNTDNNEK